MSNGLNVLRSGTGRRWIRQASCDPLGGRAPECRLDRVAPAALRLTLEVDLDRPVQQDDWRLSLTLAFDASFHWAPHLTPTDRHVIDQHSFRSPALIASGRDRALVLLPDLNLLAGGSPVPWYLDLDAPRRLFVLGRGDRRIEEHVLYTRNPGSRYPAGIVRLGCHLLLLESPEDVANPFRAAGDFLWEAYGDACWRSGQPGPGDLSARVRHAYAWAFERWPSVWQEFPLGGTRVGAPVFIVNTTQSPNFPGQASEREDRSIWNQAWFSSLRSASGLFRHARKTGNAGLRERALLTKELALLAPQEKGFFPSVIATEMETVRSGGSDLRKSKGWETRYWGNSNRNPWTPSLREAPFHVLDMSWTCLLMLRWYEELEQDPRLLAYAGRYAEALLGLQDGRGFFPGWLDRVTTRPLDVLNDSPECSLSATFLLALHRITADERYRAAALRAIEAVDGLVIDAGRWEDFETYWSCSRYGSTDLVGRKVARNDMYKQCNFSMFWTAEALLESYRATGEEWFLRRGRRCLDELLMSQAIWQPPFLHVPVFGGFGVMNADAEWNDARQSLFAELIVRYGLLCGVPALVRRGAAALRASFSMMYCPENPVARVQWEKAWPFLGERDFGFTMENYAHGGSAGPDGTGMGEFCIYDWGCGAAAECCERMLDHLGPTPEAGP